jgi:hypothetical protein
VGGVVGGVAGISIIAAVIFFYLRRRRSRARSAATPGFGASQPPIDETKQPLTEEGINTVSSLPGTSSMPGTPGAPMRLYVRAFIPDSPPCTLCAHHACFLPFFFFLIRRTRMIQLRSLGLSSLQPDPCRHRTGPETPCKPRGHRDITVCLLSDFAPMNHWSPRSGVRHVLYYFIPFP